MGKKRVIKKTAEEIREGTRVASLSRLSKKKISQGILHIQSSYNNTLMFLTDGKGELLAWSSAGALGFRGARKGTPFAASRAAEILAEKAKLIGIKEVRIMMKGVGAGREAAIRSFAANKEINILSIQDITPLPHNGPRPPKPRRV
jgi:small subunit ribosomal protein S11